MIFDYNSNNLDDYYKQSQLHQTTQSLIKLTPWDAIFPPVTFASCPVATWAKMFTDPVTYTDEEW